jgi:hypothetical protein
MRLFPWLVGVTLVYCAGAACFTAPEQQPAMFGHDAFASASEFINRTARPLERALFAFYFAKGSRDAVIAELAKFQNKDGGFASDLESDVRWSGSSPMATRVGLRILNEVNAPAEDAHVQAAVRYLLASFDDKKGYWYAVPKEVNSAPHAPWWHFHEENGKCEVESPVFPTAALAGYLRAYSGQLPERFLDRITKSSLDYLSAAPVRMQMPDIEMLTELVRFLPRDKSSEAVGKIRSVLAVVVVRDSSQWRSYSAQPLMFIHTPDSPFYAGMETEVTANLTYRITTQEADGGWALNWSWEKSDPIAWKLAEREWRGVVTLENLQRLKAFGRMAR